MVFGLSLVGLILFVVGLFIVAADFSAWDFRNNLWGPAHLTWRGQSPYAVHRLFPDGSNAIWLPQAVGIFVPLGLLPLREASNAWLLVNISGLAVLNWHLLKRANGVNPEPGHLGIVLLASALFLPTIQHFILGQIDLLIILSLVFGSRFIETRQLLPAAALYAFGLTKPQLCIVVLPMILSYLISKQQFSQGLNLIGSIMVTGLIMTIPLWMADTVWWRDLMANLRRNPQWEQPSTWWLVQSHVGSPVLALGIVGALLAGSILLALDICKKAGPVPGTVWGLALTTVAGTYLWSWDFVLLLPLFIDTAARARRPAGIIGLATVWLGVFVFGLLSLQPGPASNARLWWLPYWVFFGLALCRRWVRSAER